MATIDMRVRRDWRAVMTSINPLFMQRLLLGSLLLDTTGTYKPINHALFVYGVGVVALIALRPRPVYDPEGRARLFGSSKEDTVLPFWIASTAPALIYLFAAHEAYGM